MRTARTKPFYTTQQNLSALIEARYAFNIAAADVSNIEREETQRMPSADEIWAISNTLGIAHPLDDETVREVRWRAAGRMLRANAPALFDKTLTLVEAEALEAVQLSSLRRVVARRRRTMR